MVRYIHEVSSGSFASLTEEQVLADVERECSDGGDTTTTLAEAPSDTTRGGPNAERYRAEWRRLQAHLPRRVSELLCTIYVLAYRVDAAYEVERRVHGWDRRRRRDSRRPLAWVRLDAAGVRQGWEEALADPRKNALQKVRWVVDAFKNKAQVALLHHHEVADDVADWQRRPDFASGTVATRDVERGTSTFGVRSYPEVTPVEVVMYVMAFLETYYPRRVRPWRVTDLTGGSGTVSDLVLRLFDAEVEAIDLALENGVVRFGNLLRIDASAAFTAKPPHVVFLHPPSRGKPSISAFYDVLDNPADLSTFSREDWIRAVVFAVVFSLNAMADGGVVSLLLPEGTREHQHVHPDSGLTDDVISAFEGHVLVIERLRISFIEPCKQAMLGEARVPTTHLLLSRGEAW